MIDRASVEDRAKIARVAFEKGAVPGSVLTQGYSAYNPVENMELFIQRAKTSFPKGNCGLASLYLKQILGGGEIVQGKYASNSHTFLLLNGKVVDITADQFGGPKVYFGDLRLPWSIT